MEHAEADFAQSSRASAAAAAEAEARAAAGDASASDERGVVFLSNGQLKKFKGVVVVIGIRGRRGAAGAGAGGGRAGAWCVPARVLP